MNLYLLLPLILAVFAFGNLSSSFAEIESIDVVENKLVTLIGEGFDSDTSDLSFKWTQIYGEPVKLSSTTEPEPTFMAPNVKNGEIKVLTFELLVTDPQAGADITVDENTVASLVCTGTDPDGNKLGFTWSTSSKAVIEQTANPKTLVQIPNVVRDSTMTFTCTVSDGTYSSSDSMNVLVRNTLSSDIISNAGMDRIVNENVKVSLDGSKSNDPENQQLSFHWTQLSGEKVKLSSASSVNPSFTSPIVNNNEIKVLTFELRVFDDNERESMDTVVITVDPVNSPPEASASAKQ